MIVLACVACAACAISLALTSSLAIATLSLAVGGAGWVTAWSGFGINVQLVSPRWVVGRTISIHSAFTYGGIAGGSWLWGSIAETCSLPWALGWSAAAPLVVAVLGLKLPVSNRSGSELEPLGEFSAPTVALDLKPRSGPILITTEYSIPEENVDLFLDVMRERRHIQSRVGARHWTLTRDVQETPRWIETYRTPTWTDYHRLHHRLTAADKLSDQELLKARRQSRQGHRFKSSAPPRQAAGLHPCLTFCRSEACSGVGKASPKDRAVHFPRTPVACSEDNC